MDLWGYLDDILEKERNLADEIEVEDLEELPSLSNLKLEVGKWFRVRNVVSMYADMVASTKLSLKSEKPIRSAARIHQLFTGSLVDVYRNPDFGPSFFDVKGDGGFALWKEEFGSAKAVIAAATFKTLVEKRLRDYVRGNYKSDWHLQSRIGIAKGVVLVKRIGTRNVGDEIRNWAVWVGKPVNLSSKLSDKADPDTVLATKNILADIRLNDELTNRLIWSCGCPYGKKRNLWKEVDPGSIGLYDVEENLYRLESKWCDTHGDEYINTALEEIEKASQ